MNIQKLVDAANSLVKMSGNIAGEWRHAKGMSEIDDTQKLLTTAFGPQIYGLDGEVRLVVTKSL